MKVSTIVIAAGLVIGAASAASAGNKATIVQQGVYNGAYTSQSGAFSNKSTTVQYGLVNSAYTSQSGFYNHAGIGQVGAFNSGAIVQKGPFGMP